MKTYWLETREARSPLTRTPALGQRTQWERAADRTPVLDIVSDDRRVYSPVMFPDVAQRSVGSSPVKGPPRRECRSNSLGTALLRASGSSGSGDSHPLLPPTSWPGSPRGSLSALDPCRRPSAPEEQEERPVAARSRQDRLQQCCAGLVGDGDGRGLHGNSCSVV